MGIIASLDIDAQKGFTPLCPNELPVAGGDTIVAALNAQAALATLRTGSKDAHPANAPWVVTEPGAMLQPLALANADLTWPAHCVPGTPGFELLDGLPAPIDYDFFVWKGVEPDLHPYGACYHDLAERRSTGLIEFLQAAASLPCWSAASPPTIASRPACCNCVAPVSGSSSTSTPAAASPPRQSTRPAPG